MNKREVCKSSALSLSSSGSEDAIIRNKQKNRGRKRKRRSSSSEDELDLPSNTLETERNLQASAAKNNLDENSVRKILKKVVTNDHVLALVKLKEEEEGDSGSEDKNVQPKLTRSKAKELMKVSPRSAPWNLENLELTPINHIPVKTRPEVKALIAQELPEDEDDEEYEPTHDDVPSDDDQEQSCSDLDSQPRTPVTPASQCTPSPKVLKDGPFKVPQDVSTARRKLDIDEKEATIALRTRSKLSLSTTTIEHIESSFVPPDDVQPPVDNLWSQFLTSCLGPAATHDDDDEADPEYNAAADADTLDEDEDFLGSSLIKISKKELNDLVTELFSVMPAADDDLTLETLANSVLTDTSQTEVPRWEGKTEPLSDEEIKRSPSNRLTFEKGGTVAFSPGKSEIEDTPRTQTTNHVPCGIIEPMNTRASLRARENATVGKEIPKSRTAKSPPKRRSDTVHMCIEERGVSPPRAAPAPPAPPALRKQLQADSQTVHIQLNTDVVFTHEQVLILQQQLRMHIQLAASNFLQLYVHPVHWQIAPVYKDYLETLETLSENTENSVASVCNLKPALELIRHWEASVSKDTPENVKMVEFIDDQVERCRRRFAQNSLFTGDFPEKMKEVVANSPVFLYPYLLPPIPFKPDHTKRVVYQRSEDKLIVLGLDQFWRYMEENPTIFRRPTVNSRHRWGLATALQLVVKHMLPWMTPKQLASHVNVMRTQTNSDNPIHNYFANNELPKVQHTILPYNEQLTLYDQPGHEITRLWLRYLAKSNKRFKSYLSRSQSHAIPTGVPINSATPESTTKVPLPHDFTKQIKCTRNPEDPLTKENDANVENVPLNMYKLVSTSKGSYLVPLDLVKVNSNGGICTPANREVLEFKSKLTVCTGTVATPAEVPSTLTPVALPQPKPVLTDTEHCPCCILLRRMMKRQTKITDYFSRNKSDSKCYCSKIKYPNVTNKLRMLSNNFKNSPEVVYKDLERLLEDIQQGRIGKENERLGRCNLDELASVTTFQLKILSRSLMSKFSYIKVRCKNLMSQFNPDTGDPLRLAQGLFKTCEKEMVDLYLDFLEFLTPEQADRVGKFRDYFVRNCARDLMNKIELQVKDTKARERILTQLRHVFGDATSTSCEICCYLLESMVGYDHLAAYTFSLFPHKKQTAIPATSATRSKASCKTPVPASEPEPVAHVTITEQEQSTESEGADDSENEDDDDSGSEEAANKSANISVPLAETHIQNNGETMSPEIKTEIDEMDFEDGQLPTISNPVMITLEEESIKEEPSEPSEWKREEDKLILQVLQQQLTPEERKDNIPQMLEEKNVFGHIAGNMKHKSKEEVKERVLYILSMLVLSES